MENFYDRTQLLVGSEQYEKIKKTSIAVLGVGGVGSWVCESLTRMGVENIKIVDFDCIDITNINRQIHALTNTIGLKKVDIMKERMLLINPKINVETSYEKINENHLSNLFSDTDYTIDCIDDVLAKTSLIKWHIDNKKKIISCMGTGNKIGTHPFQIKDISKTKVCPLARAVRGQLKKLGIYSGVPVLFSEEIPKREFAENSSSPGTISYMPAIAALEITRYITLEILR